MFRIATLRRLLAEEGLTPKAAASPSGKAQEAIMAYLEGQKGEVKLTDMSKDQSFRGIHFAKIMSAMNALAKKGLISHREEKGEGDFLKKTAKTALDWEEFSKPAQTTPGGWKNYNTIGPRRFLKTMLQIMESREPGSWKITEDPAEIAKLKKKWGRRGQRVDERGVKGLKVTRGFKNLFIGRLGGKEVAVVDARFKL